jgi:endo-1,4-beta-D-glucanase Y
MRSFRAELERIALLACLAAGAACNKPGAAGPDAADEASSDAPAAGAADAPPVAAGLPHPFGTHGGYIPIGVVFPSNHTQGELDAATAAYYDTWKATYLVPGCNPGEYRVKSAPTTGAFTVSEAHGNGMLIAVIMDGHDPDAHAIYDGLYAYYAKHPSDVDGGLMAWAQDLACNDVQGADSATDGDLDIAYSLLLADREWGSAGAIDYHAAAMKIIAAILAGEVQPSNELLVGDWARGDAKNGDGTRPSDFMIAHFRTFAVASADQRWMALVEHTYGVIAYMQKTYAPKTGLLPDFATGAGGATPAPAPARWLEGPDDGFYDYNACRVPWRIATDYLMWGEPRARDAVRPIEAWLSHKTAGDPQLVRDGYQLSGLTYGHDPVLAFVAPIAVGAMIEPATGTNQPWLNALWDDMAGRGTSEYYGDTLKLLAMIVISGNWWSP